MEEMNPSPDAIMEESNSNAVDTVGSVSHESPKTSPAKRKVRAENEEALKSNKP
jgi:hypothetical protein